MSILNHIIYKKEPQLLIADGPIPDPAKPLAATNPVRSIGPLIMRGGILVCRRGARDCRRGREGGAVDTEPL